MSNGSLRAPRWGTAGGLAICFALGLLLRAPAARIPFERDEGNYAYIAQGWLDGRIPYLTVFDQKPPGIFAAYAATFRFFGSTPSALHWTLELWTLGTLALLYLTGARLYSRRVGFCAAALGAWMTTAPCFRANAANSELFMLLPLTGSFWAALAAEDSDSTALPALAGLLAGGAALFKQVALPNAAFLALILARRADGRTSRLAGFGAGLAALPAAVAAYFAAKGSWTPFYDCVARYNLLTYASQVPLLRYPENLAAAMPSILKEGWAAVGLAAFGLAAKPSSSANPRARGLVLGWLSFSMLGVAAGGFFREHYFLQIVPAVALLSASGAEHFAARMTGRMNRSAAVVAVVALTIALGLLAAPDYYGRSAPEEKSRSLYGLNPFPESPELARFAAARTRPEDSLFVLGSEPQILFLADRRSATRYILAYPLMAAGAVGLAAQKETLADFDRAEPKLVITEYSRGAFLPGRDSSRWIFDEVSRRLAASYRTVGLMASDFSRGKNRLWLGEEDLKSWEKNSKAGSWTPSLIVWERRAPSH